MRRNAPGILVLATVIVVGAVLRSAGATNPEITNASTSYERGGTAQGIVQLQIIGFDTVHAKILLDGSDRYIDTISHTATSVTAKLHDDTPLGRHILSVQSGRQRTDEHVVDIVAMRFQPIGVLHTGQVTMVHVSVDGLGKDTARVVFTVSGAAAIADGSASKSVPVVDGNAEIAIRGVRAGQLLVNTALQVDIPQQQVAEATPFPYLTTSRPPGVTYTPSPTPTPYKSNNDHTTSSTKETPPPTIGRPPKVQTTTKPPTPTPPPTEPPSTPPTVYPSPTPTPTPPCSVKVTDGWFEPMQGVWQDDPKFDDHPTKQLTRTSAPGDPPAYNAELDMISNRDTLLFGIEHYQYNGTKVEAGLHSVIEMSGTSDCSDPPVPVKMQFTFTLGTGQTGRKIWTSDVVANIRLTGHQVAEAPWTAMLTGHGDGIPPPDTGPFKITSFGDYVIEDELIRADNGAGTGLSMTVGGRAHATSTLKIAYVPLILTPLGAAATKQLDDDSEKLGTEAGKYMPDFYPMTPHAIEGWAYDVMDLSNTNVLNPTMDRTESAFWIQYTKEQRVKATLAQRFDLLARESGFQRMVLLLTPNDMEIVEGKNVLGAAITKKFVLLQQGQTYYTVAHEIAHTFAYLWSSPQMIRDCTQPGDYHNTGGYWANGYRIDTANAPGPREDKDQSYSFMSYTSSQFEWIDQCTYWNLAKELEKKPDPAMMLVRGAAFRKNGRAGVFLWPLYDLNGEVDLVSRMPAADEHWRIDVLNDRSTVIASYPFEPQWADEDGHIQELVPIAYEIPAMRDAAAIELRGPTGYIRRVVFSHTPPVVHIVTPAAGNVVHGLNGAVPVTWNATGEAGRKLLATVLYSPNNGAAWYQRVFEEPVHSANVQLDPKAKTHWIKIIVTDGTRSTESIAKFTTP